MKRRDSCIEDSSSDFGYIARCGHGITWPEGAAWGDRTGDSCEECCKGTCDHAKWTDLDPTIHGMGVIVNTAVCGATTDLDHVGIGEQITCQGCLELRA